MKPTALFVWHCLVGLSYLAFVIVATPPGLVIAFAWAGAVSLRDLGRRVAAHGRKVGA